MTGLNVDRIEFGTHHFAKPPIRLELSGIIYHSRLLFYTLVGSACILHRLCRRIDGLCRKEGRGGGVEMMERYRRRRRRARRSRLYGE